MPHAPVRPVRPTSRALLTRLLDEPDLPAHIQELPAPALSRLIDHVGLHDAGEILALATADQLAAVLDEDLWKNERPGEEERFDPARFVVWLEVLLEAGDAFVARKLAELPEDLVTLAFHHHVLVLDVDQLASDLEEAGEEGELTDKALQSCLGEELDSYQLLSRNPDGWDSVLAAILALDRDHHPLLVRILDRCASLTSEYIEDNGGLYDVLTSSEMLESDAAADREDRRAEEGYVAPQTAKSFLRLCTSGGDASPREHDAVTRAYFRGLAKTPAGRAKSPAGREEPASRGTAQAPLPAGASTASTAAAGTAGTAAAGTAGSTGRPGGIWSLLREAGVLEGPAPQKLGAGAASSAFVAAMRRLAVEDPALFAERTEELAYLTNVLVAGYDPGDRRLRPAEAAALAIATCDAGLALVARSSRGASASLVSGPSQEGAASPDDAFEALRAHPADGLFRVAWQKLSAGGAARAMVAPHRT
ncbi:MAG: DUF6178 family protein [Polyangiaceae bacterium]